MISYTEERTYTSHAAYEHLKKIKGGDSFELSYYQCRKKIEEKIMATVFKKQCPGLGRPTMLENLEDILYDVIVDMHIKK